METLETLQRTVDAQQAAIDKLMFEFCPEEMTTEQLERWKKSQKPALLTTALLRQELAGVDNGMRISDAFRPTFFADLYNTLKHYEENVKLP